MSSLLWDHCRYWILKYLLEVCASLNVNNKI